MRPRCNSMTANLCTGRLAHGARYSPHTLGLRTARIRNSSPFCRCASLLGPFRERRKDRPPPLKFRRSPSKGATLLWPHFHENKFTKSCSEVKSADAWGAVFSSPTTRIKPGNPHKLPQRGCMFAPVSWVKRSRQKHNVHTQASAHSDIKYSNSMAEANIKHSCFEKTDVHPTHILRHG